MSVWPPSLKNFSDERRASPGRASDVRARGLIAHNPARLHYGVAVVDADGDGRDEFIVAGFGCPNRVLRVSTVVDCVARIRRRWSPAIGLHAPTSTAMVAKKSTFSCRHFLGAETPGRPTVQCLPDGRWEISRSARELAPSQYLGRAKCRGDRSPALAAMGSSSPITVGRCGSLNSAPIMRRPISRRRWDWTSHRRPGC